MNLPSYCEDLARRARTAARLLAAATSDQKNRCLVHAAEALQARVAEILEGNRRDIAAAAEHQLTPAQIDRLRLTPDRLAAAAEGLRQIAALPDPVGTVLDKKTRPNGLQIHKVSVPIGVIFFIYESRPNVTIDAAALCVKSGNAVILRGGKEALHSNAVLEAILRDSLRARNL